MTNHLLCAYCPKFKITGETFGKCSIDNSMMAFYWCCDKNDEHKKFLESLKLSCE